jgi:hypothetical protein
MYCPRRVTLGQVSSSRGENLIEEDLSDFMTTTARQLVDEESRLALIPKEILQPTLLFVDQLGIVYKTYLQPLYHRSLELLEPLLPTTPHESWQEGLREWTGLIFRGTSTRELSICPARHV